MPPTPFARKIWHFNRANTVAIKKNMTSFPWIQHLSLNTNPNWQVKTFTDVLLNIMSNFVPNETKRLVPRDPSWINKPLKSMLYKSYKRHGYREEGKVTFRGECQLVVDKAKLSYLTNLGNKMNDPDNNSKQCVYSEL